MCAHANGDVYICMIYLKKRDCQRVRLSGVLRSI